MPSTRPKIQAYLDEALHQRFEEWRQERGFQGDSAALTELLKEFFEVEPNYKYKGIPDDRLRILIQEELWDSGKRDFIEGIKAYAEEVIAKKVVSAQQYWQALDQKEEIKELRVKINELEARLKSLENPNFPEAARKLGLKPLDVSEGISNKLHSPSAEALNCSQLARRLGCNHGTISKKRQKPDFEEWTKAKDPDAIAWRYDREKKLFFPL